MKFLLERVKEVAKLYTLKSSCIHVFIFFPKDALKPPLPFLTHKNPDTVVHIFLSVIKTAVCAMRSA